MSLYAGASASILETSRDERTPKTNQISLDKLISKNV